VADEVVDEDPVSSANHTAMVLEVARSCQVAEARTAFQMKTTKVSTEIAVLVDCSPRFEVDTATGVHSWATERMDGHAVSAGLQEDEIWEEYQIVLDPVPSQIEEEGSYWRSFCDVQECHSAVRVHD